MITVQPSSGGVFLLPAGAAPAAGLGGVIAPRAHGFRDRLQYHRRGGENLCKGWTDQFGKFSSFHNSKPLIGVIGFS